MSGDTRTAIRANLDGAVIRMDGGGVVGETLSIGEVRILLTLAAVMHDDGLLGDGTDERVRAVAEKASRMKREGYVAVVDHG